MVQDVTQLKGESVHINQLSAFENEKKKKRTGQWEGQWVRRGGMRKRWELSLYAFVHVETEVEEAEKMGSRCPRMSGRRVGVSRGRRGRISDASLVSILPAVTYNSLAKPARSLYMLVACGGDDEQLIRVRSAGSVRFWKGFGESSLTNRNTNKSPADFREVLSRMLYEHKLDPELIYALQSGRISSVSALSTIYLIF